MSDAPHIPVLIEPILAKAAPVTGVWLDGTFGAGGYSRALLEAGATRIIGIDRDPDVHAAAQSWIGDYHGRMDLHMAPFSQMAEFAEPATLGGVVLDIGVSSMQIDQPDRGFSFQKDGPLDMRMSQSGETAADLVNGMDEGPLADLIYKYGEERASRRIARAIVSARALAPITTTAGLAHVVSSVMPKPRPGKPGQIHPATRTFQALRIAVNDELGELEAALEASLDLLAPGGRLVIVTFHSLEDRIVKTFMQDKASRGGGGSRHAPAAPEREPVLKLVNRKPIIADEDEAARNPRARSAKLRIATRLEGAL